MESRTRIITCNAREYLVTEGVHLFEVIFGIQGGGPPTTFVHLFDYPFEESEAEVKTAFNALSRVKCVKPQAYLSRPSISTDTVLISLVTENSPPRGAMIRGYYCRAWDRGQPLICDVCRKEGPRSSDCSTKDKCVEYGHFALASTATPLSFAEVVDGASESAVPEPDVSRADLPFEDYLLDISTGRAPVQVRMPPVSFSC